LGAFGRPFTVFANYTKLRLAGSRTADFNRFIPESMNWGVTISRNPITFMAKWHHRGEQNRGPSTGQGPFASVYQDARTTLDLNLTYQASKRISLFINCRNVANVHFNQSRYQADTPAYARRSSANSYGALGSFGLRGTF
jgi:outer membrane receptor for ferric coprogen and ferric-rhodotorulic acid